MLTPREADNSGLIKVFIPISRQNVPWSNLCWLPGVLSLCSHLKSLLFILLFWQTMIRSHRVLSSPRWATLFIHHCSHVKCSNPLITFIVFPWLSPVFLCCFGTRETNSVVWQVLSRVRITSLDLLTVLLVMQSRTQLAFTAAARAHRWFMLSPGTLRAFCGELLPKQSDLSPVILSGDYSVPDIGLYISLCWTSCNSFDLAFHLAVYYMQNIAHL